MSTTKLGPGTATAETATADTAALAALDDNTPANFAPTPTDGTLVLSGGASRMRTSYLNIAYSVCKWFKQDGSMHDGGVVLDREIQIAKPGEQFQCLILGAKEIYREWADKDFVKREGRFPKTYQTEAEAIADGKQTQGYGKARTAAPAWDLRLLVKKPEGIEHPAFSLRLGDAWYALVGMRAEKMVADDVGTFVKNLAMIDLKEGQKTGNLSTWLVGFSTRRVVKGESKWTTLAGSRIYDPATKSFLTFSDEARADLKRLQDLYAGAWNGPTADDDEAVPAEPPVATGAV